MPPAPLKPDPPPARPAPRRALLRAIGRGLRTVAFPAACVSCGAVVAEDGLPLCPACVSALDPADPAELAAHLAGPAALDDARAAWRYDPDGPLGALLHAIKYGHRPRYARLLGRVLAARLPLPPPDALVPIPLTRARFLERGYNQTAEIALGLGEITGWPVREDMLRRGAFTRSQTRLDRSARRRNVAHAFTARPEASGLHLLLIDDVVTTGATVAAAAEALREMGAASVSLVAVAWTR